MRASRYRWSDTDGLHELILDLDEIASVEHVHGGLTRVVMRGGPTHVLPPSAGRALFSDYESHCLERPTDTVSAGEPQPKTGD